MVTSTDIARGAKKASNLMKTLSEEERNEALKAIYSGLKAAKEEILKANAIDMKNAEKLGLSSALVKRLDLSKGDKFDVMLQGVLDVAELSDPVGRVTLSTELDDGLELKRITCPIGVLLIIFESRPEVIANISALAIKSGNAAILKGGKESTQTFELMSNVIRKQLETTKIPKDGINLVSSRDQVGELLNEDDYIDLVIPRGSNQLVKSIKENTKIPVMGHADGICALYIHNDADPQMANRIAIDAKTNYPAGCNAIETLLINKDYPHSKELLIALRSHGVKLRLSPELEDLANQHKIDFEKANEDDFHKEFLALEIAVKEVNSLEEAIEHINDHSSHHTDAIVTSNESAGAKFQKGVDSAGVYVNASTRFADGFRYGFGAEVGVSTNRLHARGPVGLDGLVSYQYLISGHGQVAGDYKGAGGQKDFTHKNL